MSFPVWGLRACPRKKINFALKLCNSEQVLVLLSYITAESGDYPSHKSGDLSPAPTPMGLTADSSVKIHRLADLRLNEL